MSDKPPKDLSELYSDKFDNWAEVAHPQIAFNPSFDVLMQKALDRGTPLTQEEVEAEFGKLAWDW